MQLSLLDLLVLFSIVQLLSFAVILGVLKRGRKSNRLLALLLLSLALNFTNFMLFLHLPFFADLCPHVFYIGSPFAFLWGPLLLLYTRSLLYADVRWTKNEALHALPFLVLLGYQVAAFHLHSADVKRTLLFSSGVFSPRQEYLITAALHVQIMIYVVATIRILRAYRRELREIYSSVDQLNLWWLSVLLAGFLFVWTIDLIRYIAWGGSAQWRASLEVAIFVSLLVFYNVMIFFGIRQPRIFQGIDRQAKYGSSALRQPEYDRALETLKAYMSREKPYLKPTLTLPQLAGDLSVLPHHLSRIINESFGKNFFDFVNSYRIEEAKRLLKAAGGDRTNVLQILYEAGFNSKSAFHRAFKRHTGSTPTAFKKGA